MFENIIKFFKNLGKKDKNKESSDTAKERLHLVLMQDRANVSADFLELMKQEIIEVIKKYIDIDEKAIDVHLTNKTNDDGTVGAPALYANIPIMTIKNEARVANVPHNKKEEVKQEDKKPDDNKEQTEEVKQEESTKEPSEQENKSETDNKDEKEEVVKEEPEDVEVKTEANQPEENISEVQNEVKEEEKNADKEETKEEEITEVEAKKEENLIKNA